MFRTFAPIQLKNAVTDLFQQLEIQVRIAGRQTAGEEEQIGESMSMVQQQMELSKIIAEKLEEIFFEDAKFNTMLLWYLTESEDYANVIKPYFKYMKSLKILHQENLEQAFS